MNHFTCAYLDQLRALRTAISDEEPQKAEMSAMGGKRTLGEASWIAVFGR
jgi:hypothetical protein